MYRPINAKEPPTIQSVFQIDVLQNIKTFGGMLSNIGCSLALFWIMHKKKDGIANITKTNIWFPQSPPLIYFMNLSVSKGIFSRLPPDLSIPQITCCRDPPRKTWYVFFPTSPISLKHWRFQGCCLRLHPCKCCRPFVQQEVGTRECKGGSQKLEKHRSHPLLLFWAKMKTFLKTSSVKFLPGSSFCTSPLLQMDTFPTNICFVWERCHPRKRHMFMNVFEPVFHFPHRCCRPLVEWCTNRSMGLQNVIFNLCFSKGNCSKLSPWTLHPTDHLLQTFCSRRRLDNMFAMVILSC